MINKPTAGLRHTRGEVWGRDIEPPCPLWAHESPHLSTCSPARRLPTFSHCVWCPCLSVQAVSVSEHIMFTKALWQSCVRPPWTKGSPRIFTGKSHLCSRILPRWFSGSMSQTPNLFKKGWSGHTHGFPQHSFPTMDFLILAFFMTWVGWEYTRSLTVGLFLLNSSLRNIFLLSYRFL